MHGCFLRTFGLILILVAIGLVIIDYLYFFFTDGDKEFKNSFKEMWDNITDNYADVGPTIVVIFAAFLLVIGVICFSCSSTRSHAISEAEYNTILYEQTKTKAEASSYKEFDMSAVYKQDMEKYKNRTEYWYRRAIND